MTIAFWSVLEHHALALRPVYDKMKAQGKDVVDLFNHPVRELLPYLCIVSGTAPDIPPAKRLDTIYHFHSLSPYHINPAEDDYKLIPLFKGVMFPGRWWVDKWSEKPKHWAIVGWPKNDLLRPTVLYASSMFDMQRMETLRLLVALSETVGFTLLVKPHCGTAKWFPAQLRAMARLIHLEENTRDISEYFSSADVLVSESSGALWEFMATGKPSIQMQQGERWGRVFPGGVQVASFETLEKVLKEALSVTVSDWCEKVMGRLDGKATDRAIEFIERVFSE